MRKAIVSHLNHHHLFSHSQHGFVPNKSCTTNLLETVDFISYKLAKKRPVDVIFLDFAKAFDTVPHARLLVKLEAYGISGSLLRWVGDFLSERTQRVVLGPHASREVQVASGVPQGSVLGPTLFTIYVNDLLEAIGHSCKAYADDTKLLGDAAERSERLQLQSDIDTTVSWSDTWLVKLHDTKCKVMHFGKNNPHHTYHTRRADKQAHPLESTTCERDLGVMLSNTLSWSAQCAHASNKANAMLSALKRTFVSRDVSIWNKLYKTYVRPHVEFAVAAWSPYMKKDIATLEKVQRRATKVPSALKELAYEDRCKALGLTDLETRRARGDLLTRFKIDKGLEVVNWHKPPPQSSFAGQLFHHRELVKSNSQRFNFLPNRTASAWSNLYQTARTIDSVNKFKALMPTRAARAFLPHCNLLLLILLLLLYV